jgi:hypothetical protein
MRKIILFTDALPIPLFRRLVRAVHAVGTERLNGSGSYTTTFWFPCGAKPANVVEEALVKLRPLVRPGPMCIGMEWWLGRLKYGQPLSFHVDRDLSLYNQTGRTVHPLWSSVLYLNRFGSSPTVILDQVLGPDGSSLVPPEANFGKAIDTVPNEYAAFRGNLRHGVVVNRVRRKAAGSSSQKDKSPKLRLTLLVNYWNTRPMAPICLDYDGTIYQPLQKG